MGGNGAAIRTSIIGLRWHNDIDKIIEESIISSRLTHNYSIGFLGGLITALFTSFALNEVKPWLWIDKLLEIYESKKILKFINSTEEEEVDNYFYFWRKYKEERLINIMKFRRTDEFLNPLTHITIMLEYNPLLKKAYKKGEISLNSIGTSGLDSVIFAYDCLLLSIVPQANYTINLDNIEYSWDSLVFFGCLHVGDTDSTGIILGSWFGALNGYGDINISKIKELEFYKNLKEVSDKIFKSI
jgi:ADP-ribosylarginine hydrolase